MSRIDSLVAQFDGAIKYVSLLCDHPEWPDEKVILFAKAHHATAIDRLRVVLKKAYFAPLTAEEARLSQPLLASPWNEGIPYCRNIPTAKMIEEARRGW